MRRYLVEVFSYDGTRYMVTDRLTGKVYCVDDRFDAFLGFDGSIKELAEEIEVVESEPFLDVYGTAYKVKYDEGFRAPVLYLELSSVGKTKKYHEKLFRAGVK